MFVKRRNTKHSKKKIEEINIERRRCECNQGTKHKRKEIGEMLEEESANDWKEESQSVQKIK